MEIQCLASPPGTPDNYYRHIEAAIAVIEGSGLHFEVDALGTTVEGDPDALWSLARQVHEATLSSGADSIVSVVKFAQGRTPERQATIESLTGKFREGE